MSKKLKEPKVTDGKLNNPDKSQREALAAIWGFDVSKYKTTDIVVYTQHIKEMNASSLQEECARLGLLPNANRAVMEDRLIRLFEQTISAMLDSKVAEQPKIKINKRLQDILDERKSRYV